MQSLVPLPPDMGHDFLCRLLRGPDATPPGAAARQAPLPQCTASCSHWGKLHGIVSLNTTTTDPTRPPGEHSPRCLSRRRSPWSAWKCTTCCGGRCPGGRPGRRPPGSQCTPPTKWSFSQRLSGLAPPLPPRQEGCPAAAAALQGSSPPSATSAGCRAGGGSQCLPAVGPSPWREARAACSTHCWGVWWRRGCAPRCGGSRWRRSPRGHQAAVTQSTPEAAWWSRDTRGSAGPSGWSSSAAGTQSSRCACSPAAWAAGAGCSSWSKFDTPAESPGIRSPWRPVQGSTVGLVMSKGLQPSHHFSSGQHLPSQRCFPSGQHWAAAMESTGKHPAWNFQYLKQTEKHDGTSYSQEPVGTEESSQGRMKTSTDFVIWWEKQICDPSLISIFPPASPNSPVAKLQVSHQ